MAEPPWQLVSEDTAVAIFTVMDAGMLRFPSFAGKPPRVLLWDELIPPADLPGFQQAWEQSRRSGAETEFEWAVSSRLPDGSTGTCVMRIASGSPPGGTLGMLIAAARPAQRQSAELLDKSRSQLIACVTHELRTPLNAIIGFSELIAGSAPTMPVARTVEYAADIAESAHHLLSLIDEIIVAADVRVGKGDDQIVELEAELRRAARLATNCHAARQIRFEVLVGENVAIVADGPALSQMLFQLTDNAAKFSPPGSVVTITANVAKHAVRIDVADGGPGFPASVLERLGQTFVRGGDAYRADVGGLGLGLRIALNLADTIGATLSIMNRPDGGARVSVMLPVAGGSLGAAIGVADDLA